jgi:hypothetical protein
VRITLTVDLVAEWAYRAGERIGMAAEGRKPTEAQIEQAEREANDWLNEELAHREIDREFAF